MTPGAALLLTTAEVARLTGLSPRTIRTLIARRDLPSVKIGQLRRVARTDLEDWIARLPRTERPPWAVTLTGRYDGRMRAVGR